MFIDLTNDQLFYSNLHDQIDILLVKSIATAVLKHSCSYFGFVEFLQLSYNFVTSHFHPALPEKNFKHN